MRLPEERLASRRGCGIRPGAFTCGNEVQLDLNPRLSGPIELLPSQPSRSQASRCLDISLAPRASRIGIVLPLAVLAEIDRGGQSPEVFCLRVMRVTHGRNDAAGLFYQLVRRQVEI